MKEKNEPEVQNKKSEFWQEKKYEAKETREQQQASIKQSHA